MNVKDNLMESLSELTNKDNKDNTNIFFIENINYYYNHKEDTETTENTENTPINVINTPVTTNIPPDINNSIEQRSNYRSSYLSPSTPTATIRPSYTPTSLPRTPLPRTPIPRNTLSRSSLYTEPLHTEPLSGSIISRRYTSSNNQYNRQPMFTSIPIRSNIGASKEDSEDTKEEKENEDDTKEEQDNNEDTNEERANDDDYKEEAKEDDLSSIPPLIQIENEHNINNLYNNTQTYLESTSLNNIQNMIDSILGTIPNMSGELSIEFPISNVSNSLETSQFNSIDNINNNSYLISIHENNKENYIYDECPICNINYQEGDIIRKFERCPHFFHYKCIDKWLNTNKNCPVCTVDII
tara:strand:+ start:72 stop:1136 length:1065 start_codon:yes stop_codon:yes gene_type:complete